MFELLSFEGRYSRGRFWLESALSLFVFATFFSVELVLRYKNPGHVETTAAALLIFKVLYLFCFLITVAAAAKRCHDLDKSALRLLIGLVPVFGVAWLLFELGLIPGSPETNRYGLPERGLRMHYSPADENLTNGSDETDLNGMIDDALAPDRKQQSALHYANSNNREPQSEETAAQPQFGKRRS